MTNEFAKEITSRFLYIRPQIDGIVNWPTEDGDPIETETFSINAIGDDSIIISCSGGWQDTHTLELKMIKDKLTVTRDFGPETPFSQDSKEIETIMKASENLVAEAIPEYSIEKLELVGGTIITEEEEEIKETIASVEESTEIVKVPSPDRENVVPLELERFKFIDLKPDSVIVASGGNSSPALMMELKENKGNLFVVSINDASKATIKVKSPEISESLCKGIDLYGRGLESKFRKAISPYLEKIKNWKNINGWPQVPQERYYKDTENTPAWISTTAKDSIAWPEKEEVDEEEEVAIGSKSLAMAIAKKTMAGSKKTTISKASILKSVIQLKKYYASIKKPVTSTELVDEVIELSNLINVAYSKLV